RREGRRVSAPHRSRAGTCPSSVSGSRGRARAGQQHPHRVAGLSPLLHPLRRPVQLDLDGRRIGQGIVVTDDLDEPPIPRRARIGDHNAIRRFLRAPCSSQANVYSHAVTSRLVGDPLSRCPRARSESTVYAGGNGRGPLNLPIRPSICLRPFIIFLSCAYCLSSRFTSETVVPLPRAIRSLRLPLMTLGSRRSSGVVEPLIA